MRRKAELLARRQALAKRISEAIGKKDEVDVQQQEVIAIQQVLEKVEEEDAETKKDEESARRKEEKKEVKRKQEEKRNAKREAKEKRDAKREKRDAKKKEIKEASVSDNRSQKFIGVVPPQVKVEKTHQPDPVVSPVASPVASPDPIPATIPDPVSETSPTRAPSQPTKRALLIGINYLTDPTNRLNGCINDVKNMKTLLEYYFKYEDANIRLMSDDQVGENNPTRANIVSALQKVVSATQPGDTLFIHYSGHGSQVDCMDAVEANNPDTPNEDDCICPCDFNDYDGDSGFIIDEDLKAMIVDKIPKGAKLRAFFDACHSGTMFNIEYVWKNDEVFFDEYAPDKLSDDVLMISGSRDSQTSADSWNAQKKQAMGALTMMLIKALTNTPTIKTTWKDLLTVTRHYLADGKYDQIPQLCVARKDLVDQVVDL